MLPSKIMFLLSTVYSILDLIDLTYAEANTSLSRSSSVHRPLTEIFSRDCIIEIFVLGFRIYILSYCTLLTGVMPLLKDTTGPVLCCVVRCPLKLSTLHNSLLSLDKISYIQPCNSEISELLCYTSVPLPSLVTCH
jgi:hypothetical protein